MSVIRRAFLFSFAERYFILFANIGSAMVLARLLTPAQTGLFSVGAGLVNIAQALRDFGIANYIIKEKELTPDLLGTAIGLSLVIGGVLGVFFVAAAAPIALFFNEPSLQGIVTILSLNFLLVPFASIGTAILVREINFRAIMLISVASTTVGTATSVILAYAGYGARGLAWASVAGIVAGIAGNLVIQGRQLMVLPRFKGWRKLANFGVYASGASILRVVVERVPEVVIGRAIGVAAAGHFSRGNGILTLFQHALMGSVTSVTSSAFAKIQRDGGNMHAPFLHAVSQITVVAWPFLMMLGIMANPAILILFGPQWHDSVPVAQILCVAAGFGILGAISFMLFTAVGAVERTFRIQSVAVVVHVVGVVIGSQISLQAAAAGVVASSVVSSFLSLRAVNQDYGTSWRQIAEAVAKSLLVATVTGIIPALVIFGSLFDGGNPWGGALIGACGGAVAWLVALFAVRHPLSRELTSLTVALYAAWQRSRASR